MAEQDEIGRIRAYLAQHQTTYDRAALRRKLIDDGFDPRHVDQALAGLSGPAQPAAVSAPTVVVTLLTIVGVILLNGSICIAGLRSLGLLPIVSLLIIELAAIVLLWRRRANLARGVLFGALLWAAGTLALFALFASQF